MNNTPSDLEFLAFISALETQITMEAMLPSMLSVSMGASLLYYLSTYKAKYGTELDLPLIAVKAIEYYSNQTPSAYVTARLAMWEAYLEASQREAGFKDLEDSFDEDLWGTAFDG